MRTFDVLDLDRLLLEYNVINVDAVEKYIQTFLPKIEYKQARDWFFSSVRKFLINDSKSNSRITNISSNAAPWMKKRHEENKEKGIPDDFYFFEGNHAMTNKLNHLIDWLNSLSKTSQTKIDPKDKLAQERQKLVKLAEKYLNGLNALDVKMLLADKENGVKHHVEDWFEKLNELVDTTEEDVGVEVVKDYGSARWVKVNSEAGLQREGKLMGHCVGGYWSGVKSGKQIIYSLRDKANVPHVTIELTTSDNIVQQVKGKQNRVPVAKYVPYVKDLLNLVKAKDKTYSNTDIKNLKLSYDAQKEEFGTFRELSTVMYTDPSGIVFLNGPAENPDGSYGNSFDGKVKKIYLWDEEKEINYGNFTVNENKGYYRDQPTTHKISFNFNSASDEGAKSKEINQALADIVVKYVNDVICGNAGAKGEKVEIVAGGYYSTDDNKYGYYYDGNKLVKLSDMKVLSEYPICDVILNPEDDKYYFVSKTDHNNVLMKMTKGFSLSASDVVFVKNKGLKTDFINFCNTLEAPKDGTLLVNSANMVYKDGKWMPFIDGATLVKEMPNGGIYQFGSTYRIYVNKVNIMEWSGSITSGLRIKDKAEISRNAKYIAEFFNEKKYKVDNRERHGLGSTLKEYGILFQKGAWVSARDNAKASDDTGYVITKTGTKKGIIVDPNGVKVGDLEYNGTNTVLGVSITNKEAGEFLVRFSSTTPKAEFPIAVNYVSSSYGGGRSFNTDLFKLGFMAHKDKFVRIQDVYPDKEVVRGTFTWKRKAYVITSKIPSEFNYGLYDGDRKLKLVITCDDNKKIERIVPFQDGDAVPKEEINVIPYFDDILALVNTEGLTADGPFLAKFGMVLKNGALSVIDDNDKVKQFVDGRVVYEDGHKWERQNYDKNQWYLKNEKGHTILDCKITDNGIQEIKFNYTYKQNKKLYREYMNDMLDILEDME